MECLLDDPALRLKILSKAGFLYFGAIEDKDRQLSVFLEVLVSYPVSYTHLWRTKLVLYSIERKKYKKSE